MNEDGDVETVSPKRREVLVAQAWQRLLLAVDGGLNVDARTVLRDLMQSSQFFGRQYELGNPERTLELAVRRQTVIHILACLKLDDRKIDKILEIQND